MGFGANGYYGAGIEVICGPMFSGKTSELIRRVKLAQIARRKIQIFKPSIDNRYHESNVVSHSSMEVSAVPVKSSLEILKRVFDSTEIVAIDEVQFFDEDIVKVVQKLARRRCRVICAGLDQDSSGRPFGQMPQLLCVADRVDKVQAVCTVCGAPATKSYRKPAIKNQDQVLVGESDVYEARCRQCFDYFDEEREFLAYNVEQTTF